jgi:phospholipid-binding lipoprotein MlaA
MPGRGARCLSIAAALAVSLLAAAAAIAEEPAAAAHASAAAATDPLFDPGFDQQIELRVRDPIEPMNRGFFAGNHWLDRAVIGPASRFYGWVTPGPLKRAVRNVFANLNEPGVFVNDVLQSEGKRAEVAAMRFIVNSTLGLGGVWDPASRLGLPAHEADFGQTLGKAGVGPGFYLVLPLMGPSTARDLIGSVIDVAMRPDTWVLPFGQQILLGGTHGIAEREAHGRELSALERGSVDFYASVRSAYLMNREALIRDDTATHAPADRVAKQPPVPEQRAGAEQQASAAPLTSPPSPVPDP